MYVFAVFAAFPAPIKEAAFGRLHKVGAGCLRPPAPLCGILYGGWGGSKNSKNMHRCAYICIKCVYLCIYLVYSYISLLWWRMKFSTRGYPLNTLLPGT